MEAKVDIRKLQLLNDRVVQTIDALNQVRLSVHGLGQAQGYAQPQFVPGLAHSTGYANAIPGMWQQFAPAMNPTFAPTFAPAFAGSFGYAQPQFINGLAHTSGYAPAGVWSQLAAPAYNQVAFGQVYGQPVWPQLGYNVGQQAWVPGLSHSTGVVQGINPAMAQQIAGQWNTNAWTQTPWTTTQGIQNVQGIQGLQGIQGISHSTGDMNDLRAYACGTNLNCASMDLNGLNRMFQTFPFAQFQTTLNY